MSEVQEMNVAANHHLSINKVLRKVEKPRVKQNVALMKKLVGVRENCEAAGSQVSTTMLSQMQ